MAASAPSLCLLFAAALAAATAHAEMAEDALALPTDGDVSSLFPLNPAEQPVAAVTTGALLMHRVRTSILDHTSGSGDKLTSTVGDDVEGASVVGDLGAGAAVGFTGQQEFQKIETVAVVNRSSDLTEVTATQQAAVKLAVDLTSGLRGAVVVRYLHRDATLWGAPSLGRGMETRYGTSLIGFGSAFAYTAKAAGVGYAYYPPMHGKTEVSGEERIVVEPGEIAVDAYVKPVAKVTVGIRGKRWLNEVDDLATGTTAADNKTAISLLGLDPDQYVIPQQRLELGADYAVSDRVTLRTSLGQETDALDFTDYFAYRGVDVRQQGAMSVKTTLVSAAVHIVNQGVQIQSGATYFQRKAALPDAWNGGSYAATGFDLYMSAGLKL